MRHLFDRIVPFLAVCALFSGMLHADEWETQRAELLNRPRYFWNNDGGDLWHWDNTPVTIERAHARINWGVNVASKGITTYVYCPLCSAFCNQTNRTKAGDIVKPPKENRVDSVRKLHELGTDPLEIAQAYARKNKLEFLLGSRDAVENYKQRAAQYVLSRYSWENAGKKTLALYRGEPLEDTDRK